MPHMTIDDAKMSGDGQDGEPVGMSDSALLHQAEQIEVCDWHPNHSQSQLARALRELHGFRQQRDRQLAEARRHAVELEQCSLFAADVGPAIAKAMTDAAAFLRTLTHQPDLHPDSAAVDRFAAVMKAKLAKKRSDGRGGWQGAACTAELLSIMLREHVEKGDPVDVANFAMMLHQRNESILAASQDEKLARFGNHPDPAIDFCIEVEKLESRLHQAERGLSKPGTDPEAVQEVCDDICRTMDFTVGGDQGAIAAKDVLRELLSRAGRASSQDLQRRLEELKHPEPLIAYEQVTHNEAVDKCIAVLDPDAQES